VLFRGDWSYADILAWPEPDIDVEVHDPPTLLAATLSPRVTLSVRSRHWFDSNPDSDTHVKILDAAMAALPLDSLVTFTTQHLIEINAALYERFWLHHAPRWPLLRRVRLAPPINHRFIEMLLEDNGGRENPLLPSLTELVLVSTELSVRSTPRLCDALMKRVEQGVPLEVLDLRECNPDSPAAVTLLSEIVVEVLGPATLSERAHIRNMWDLVVRRLEDGNFGADD